MTTRPPVFDVERSTLTGCEAVCWRLRDRAACVALVAEVMRANATHVERVLRALESFAPPPVIGHALDEVIADLQVTEQKAIEHRDGWVFQAISWIAAWEVHTTLPGERVIALPQVRRADKGFDHLLVWLGQDGDLSLSGVVIGEDKATTNPRDTVRDDVWPSFTAMSTRDRELQASLGGLLQQHFGRDSRDVDVVVQAIIRHRRRGFRVAVTTDENRVKPQRLPKLFDGYEAATEGATHRFGEAFVIGDLRPWMTQFCADLVLRLQSLRGAAGV